LKLSRTTDCTDFTDFFHQEKAQKIRRKIGCRLPWEKIKNQNVKSKMTEQKSKMLKPTGKVILLKVGGVGGKIG
jgi:hypothetical protein